MINTCIIGGTVARPPRQFAGQKAKGLGFNLAVKDESTGKASLFMDVVVWGDESETLDLVQGDFVIAQGRLRARSYTNKDGATVWVKELSCPRSTISVIKGDGTAPAVDAGDENQDGFPF